MKNAVKIAKIAGLLAIAISTSACVTTDNVSQNAIIKSPPLAKSAAVTQQQCLSYEKVAQLQITQAGAAKLLDAPRVAELAQPAASPLVTRNSPADNGQLVTAVKTAYNIVNVVVDVPDSLIVSEDNMFVPKADIVWREDPLGDRKEQVRTILKNAISTSTASLQGTKDVILGVKVKKFHALTEKARFLTGGRHNIKFDYTLFDAATGEPVTGTNSVDEVFRAYGGRRAVAAERRGQTQRVRISQHVGKAVYDQLTANSAL
ncbi:MAG: hypothetical protein KUG74_08520 [Rhodobacteraceae bacterium]|nr:hypothetical protein [Paracoccaceae bacterium]